MMAALDLAAIAGTVGATFRGESCAVAGAAVDSRRVQPGDLFVAVAGARVDGHDFIDAAAQRGAVAVLAGRALEAPIPCLVVDDVLAALTRLARANREAWGGQLIAITGSCGKTTVKNLCRGIFEGVGVTVATAGNYNNEIGVPLTLARIHDDVRFAVVEMGATGRGDVAHLCDLARPGVSTVLNAMEAHLEGFGSVADVADIKAEIFDGLGPQSTAVVGIDSPFAALWQRRIAATGAAAITWSLEAPADVRASEVKLEGLAGSRFRLHVGDAVREVSLPLPGRHNVGNALAAAALAHAAGLAIEAIAGGLARATLEEGRLQPQRLPNGVLLVDDSYNANPGSVRAAVELLAATPGPRCLILGEMRELGGDSVALHAAMGALARKRGIDSLVGVGDALVPAVDAFGAGAITCADRDELRARLPGLLEAMAVILVKGSRGAAMERVVADLRQAAGGATAC